ncbi:LysR family transcriptional regulator [Pectobacterium peruviense]|uniref:Transcriptional regulator n=1 Tax=Pectobacterium peruviense TaxID=2066479 RepID=A0ABX4SCZ6_9GAMM|nr:LysR family transcriptional regulator [Pectobacterium peruviense]KML67220.1 transcriptional regulator [Pectobacterium peruviense]PKX81623.1 transcriptional regulator [Pectobacterium peruviense]PKX87971.1 transcriptional regulator [Pectobacterium peruviense]
MDRLQAMQVFLRIVETKSFVRAADTLSLPASTVTSTIKNLEMHLQVRLLNRTTRRVSLTPEGERYVTQCREILDLIEHTESSLHNFKQHPQGRLWVDMPSGIAHSLILPNLVDFYRRYPDIYLMIGVNDRQVDVIQEGVDCVIRTGKLSDSTLVARPLGRLSWLTCASPSYLAEYGVPLSLEDLSRHRAIHYFSNSARHASDMRFAKNNENVAMPMTGTIAVNETELYIKMCIEGYGLAQLAGTLISEHLRAGRLIEVLADWRPPAVQISLLYPHQRFLSPAVRAFSDWVSELFNDRMVE